MAMESAVRPKEAIPTTVALPALDFDPEPPVLATVPFPAFVMGLTLLAR